MLQNMFNKESYKTNINTFFENYIKCRSYDREIIRPNWCFSVGEKVEKKYLNNFFFIIILHIILYAYIDVGAVV